MSIFNAISTVIDKIFPDAESRAQAQIKLLELEKSGELAQLEVNKIEAAHRSIWVAGWRPYIGWVCGTAIAIEFIAKPVLSAFGLPTIAINLSDVMVILGGILGLGGYRTYEKIKGVTK